ncbi:MAG: hypothetical protein JWP63_7073 [Candidatus Solibacter sp.]|jgi:hypothetical protein|nr:hypothetical protein [Candidatus Solibacter sp.]
MLAIAIWLLHAAGPLAPPFARRDWYSCWHSRLVNLWILVERGELPINPHTETLWLLRAAFANAFWLRFSRTGLRNWIRGPGFILSSAATGLGLLAVLSHGFTATRTVIYTAIEWQIEPRHMRYDPRGDLVVAHVVPIAMALGIGAALVLIGRLSLGNCGGRYWLFLAAKLIAVMLLVPGLWVEGGALLWRGIAQETLRAWIAGIGSTLIFLGGFGVSVVWTFSDQRCRCPVCLRRLAQPVTFGSWASIFEPVTTEFVCEEGHGSLSLAESDIGDRDRWVALDASWRGL